MDLFAWQFIVVSSFFDDVHSMAHKSKSIQKTVLESFSKTVFIIFC